MLRALVRSIEALLLGLVVYNLLTSLFGWRDRPPARPGSRQRRFRVVVPAHDEERVIGNVIADIRAQSYDDHLVRTWVLADRCTDQTAEIARGAGVEVAERREGPEGKGPALAWYLEQHPLDDDEAFVVVDADNRVPPDLIPRLSDELDAGHDALQAYLDVSNPDASPVATASALSYWASNRMVQLARTNLGWTADLGGTGICLTARVLQSAGGFGSAAAEDQELTARLLEVGTRVVWLHDVRVRDEKPASAAVAVRQRGRWAAGRRQVARAHVGRLLAMGMPSALDLAIRLVQPSRMGVAATSAGLAIGSVLGLPFLPWPVWAGAAAIQLVAPVPFLAKEGVERRYLVRYPLLLILPALKLPARLSGSRGWYHTPHTG